MAGKVWLVGAGPGDAGLMTLKGREALSRAEVVVYDALVGDGVLGLIPEGAKLVFAGKRSGKHFLLQEQTNRALLEAAFAGKRVVRLKGGDPFVFGRGGEELELLVKHGIPFEIVPGVTSAFAVPAYNGIPVTHRDYCSSAHIITGHRRSDHSYDIDFEALAHTGGTLIFLMGIGALPDLMNGLLAAGMDPDMPAAVLERGTTASQRRVSATVGTLERACAQTVIQTPAIIVVGRVCALAETFGWAEKRPLAGVRVLVTRPRALVSTLSSMLREKGAEVLELPAIRTVPVNDMTRVDAAIETLSRGGYDWLAFTSPSGVGIFLDRLIALHDLRALGGVKLAAIGQGTQKALLKYGLRADFLPSVYDGETLGRELRTVCAPGSRILIPRAAIGNRELIEALEEGDGLTIADVATYDTVYKASRVIDVRGKIERSPEDPATEATLAVFTSASTVRGFAASVPDVDFSRVNAVCIGRQTAAEARKRGMRTWIAEKATLEALVKAVEEAARELKGNEV